MRKAFDDIGAAVPGGALSRDGLVFARMEIERIPGDEARAHVERKPQLVRHHRIAHRRNGVEIGADRERVLARYLGRVGVGHRRIEMDAVASGALGQRIDDLVVGPRADAGLGVGGDVRREQRAERRLDRPASGEQFARAGERVAGAAVAHDAEIPAALDQVEILHVDSPRGHQRRDAEQRSCGDGVRATHGRAAPGS
jgi:hypothetical protein